MDFIFVLFLFQNTFVTCFFLVMLHFQWFEILEIPIFPIISIRWDFKVFEHKGYFEGKSRDFKIRKEPKINRFDVMAFQKNMQMPSHESCDILNTSFSWFSWAFHGPWIMAISIRFWWQTHDVINITGAQQMFCLVCFSRSSSKMGINVV